MKFTKKQLIEALKDYPDDMRIVLKGYESGYADVRGIGEMRIVLDVNKGEPWYYGEHEDVNYVDNPDSNDVVSVIVIN